MTRQSKEGWAEVFYGTQVQAEELAAILQAAGLDAQVLTDSYAAWGGLPMVGAESAGLFVPEHEAARAQSLLAKTQG